MVLGYTKGDTVNENSKQLKDLWKALWAMYNRYRDAPELLYPAIELSKKESLKYIKNFDTRHETTISDKIWSCERPARIAENYFNGYTACGRCLPCKASILKNKTKGK